MKLLTESKSKSISDDFFHDTISELENSRLLLILLYPHYLTAAGLAQSVEREVAGSIHGAGPILRVLK